MHTLAMPESEQYWLAVMGMAQLVWPFICSLGLLNF